jgi:hypothetical protein
VHQEFCFCSLQISAFTHFGLSFSCASFALRSREFYFTKFQFVNLVGQIFEKYVHSWIAVTAPFEGKEIHPSSTAVMI